MGFFGKILTIAGGYVAGSMIASSLDPKKKKKIKKIKEQGGDVMTFLLNDFIETHKKLFESAKEEILTLENKQKFEAKKQELMNLADSYKFQAEKTLNDLANKGKNIAKIGVEKMEEIYEKQKLKIEEIKEISPQKAGELKEKILAGATKIKDEIIKKMK